MEKVHVASARSAVFKYRTVSLRLYSSAFRCRITVNIDTESHTQTRTHKNTLASTNWHAQAARQKELIDLYYSFQNTSNDNNNNNNY